MPSKTYIENDLVSWHPQNDMIGEGGEAEVFRVAGGVVKIYKPEDHGSYAASDALRKAAVVRLREMQAKLPLFPRDELPASVVGPEKLCYDSKGPRRRIEGYFMHMVPDARTLREVASRDFREASGMTQDDVIAVMLDLHEAVRRVHDVCPIGDFNPFNVLVSNKRSFLIDADAMPYGGFDAPSFTANYVDPLICDPHQKIQKKVKPHSRDTDWYAFAMLFFEVLMYTHPYTGVYKPKNPKDRCGPDERPLRRISLLHPEVKYPVAAVPLNALPDAILSWYKDLIEKDRREVFPLKFLTDIRFNQAAAYLAVSTTPAAVSHVSNAQASATRVFDVYAPGVILQAVVQGGRLRYLYHKDGKYMRDDGSVVLASTLDPALKFKIHGDRTLVGKTGSAKLILLPERKSISVGSFRGGAPVFDSNGERYFYVQADKLWRSSAESDKPFEVDSVVTNQTTVFAGPKFGFGFYLAGDYRRAFVFDADKPGKTSVDISVIEGELVDVRCHFSDRRLWLLAAVRDNGRIIHRCACIGNDGQVIAVTEESEGANSWLGSLRGKCAAAFGALETLASTTDDGIVLVKPDSGRLAVVKEFAGTAGMVSPQDNLIVSAKGLYVWNTREIRLVTTK